jgi:DNA invertase Pin-like site-specific DNA recombinase
VLVGFHSAAAGGGESDSDALRGIDCARLFGSDESQFVTQEAMDFLRAGDVLVIADIARLAPSIEAMMTVVERLHQAGISVHAVRNGIVPGAPFGDSFGIMCTRLAQFCRASTPPTQGNARKARRGRPNALRPEDQERAERLIKRQSVIEVARLLHVSPATLYRHFRNRRGAAKSGAKPATKPSAVAKRDDAGTTAATDS